MTLAAWWVWTAAIAAPFRMGVDVRTPLGPASSTQTESRRSASVHDGFPVRGPAALHLCRPSVEPAPGEWDFTASDSVLRSASGPVIGVLCLDSTVAPESGNAVPGEVESQVANYVEQVVRHNAETIRYWQIGGAESAPSSNHREHGMRAGTIARLIRNSDPDAIVVLGAAAQGFDSLDSSQWASFLSGAGSDAFDTVAYRTLGRPTDLIDGLREAGYSGVSLWRILDDSATIAAGNNRAVEALKSTVEAWVSGDESVFWSADMFQKAERPNPNHKLFTLVRDHLQTFTSVSRMKGLKRGQHGYRFDLADGSYRWLVWGVGTMKVPTDPYAKAMTPVLSHPDDRHQWKAVPDALPLTATPVLLRN